MKREWDEYGKCRHCGMPYFHFHPNTHKLSCPLYIPPCNASLPFEGGPMCARPTGHKGVHISASGLWTWPNEDEAL